MILQAQRNACGQPGFSGRIVPSSESRFGDEPGTGRGRVKYVVRTHGLDDGVICCAKAVPGFLGMILQEAIPHVYNGWRRTIHGHGLKHICKIPFDRRERSQVMQGS